MANFSHSFTWERMRQIAAFELAGVLEHGSHPKLADYALRQLKIEVPVRVDTALSIP